MAVSYASNSILLNYLILNTRSSVILPLRRKFCNPIGLLMAVLINVYVSSRELKCILYAYAPVGS